MGKSYKARGGSSKAAAEVTTESPLEASYANEYMAALLEAAGEKEGVDEENDWIQAQADVDAGFYDFAEDGDDKKQQALPLPELREKHAGTEYLEVEGGTSFVQGKGDEHEVDPNDVAQGALGDCYLMAGMVAVARANPDKIKQLIVDNGDGTFDVTLYIRPRRYARPEKVVTTVDGRLASKSAGSPIYAKTGDEGDDKTELWPALLEKTLAQQKGSYDKISGGNIAKDGFQFNGATELLTGKREGYFPTAGMDEDTALLTIAIALEDNKPVTADSKNMKDDAELSKEAVKYNVYGNHAYAPESADLDGYKLDLTNPWGSSHVSGLPARDFLRFYRAIRVGA